MQNILLTLSYDGSNYYGWQKQKDKITVEEKLREALFHLFNSDIKTYASSRTDRGVHALNQKVMFSIDTELELWNIINAININLPRDIVVNNAEYVADDFHPRYSAISKTYSYLIYNHKHPIPIYRNIAFHCKYNLDINKMKEACKYLIGEHDFRALSSNNPQVKSTIRTINFIEIDELDDFITIRLNANSFLYNMVRIIIGTLIEVGRNRIKVEDINRIIKSRERINAGSTAKAHGLVLEDIFYK